MIIDAHTHLGRPGGAINSRAVDLVRSMDEAGIDKALVFAGRLNSITTQQVIEEIAPYAGRLYAIGSVSFDELGGSNPMRTPASLLQELDPLLASGVIRGLKFYPGYEYYYPADHWLREVLKLLVKHDRPAIFHSGDTFSKVAPAKLKYALPIHIDDLAVEMPDLKIIIAHLGYPWQREAGEVVYKNKNVYADCSGFVYGDFSLYNEKDFRLVWEEFLRISSKPEKILFGTDWPISNQASYVNVARGILFGAVDTPTRELILYDNAMRLFHLEP